MEASGRMLEVILLLGHWLHYRQSCPLEPDRLPEVIARTKDEDKLSNAIYAEAEALTEEELNYLIADIDQMKQFIISARDIAYPEEVEECR
jgi:hypothetical protein